LLPQEQLAWGMEQFHYQSQSFPSQTPHGFRVFENGRVAVFSLSLSA
jgi:hypothetical protein